jgi:type IV secretory pathway VirB10-like protein
MVQAAYDEGDPYGLEEPRRVGIRPWVWAVPVAAVLVGGGYWALSQRGGAEAIVEKSGTWSIHPPEWNGYAALPSRPVVAERDTRLEELLKRMEAWEREHAALRKALESHKHTNEAPKGGTAPKPRPHRDMGFTRYELPKEVLPKEPTYTLAPWATVIPCQAYTKANSDTGEYMTAKVTTTVYDTKTGRIPLIPQHSTIGVRYNGADLVYGHERLPTVALELTLPSGETIDLGESPVTDQVGQAGLASSVNQHWGRLAGAVLIQGVLGRGIPQAIQSATAGANPASQVASGVATTGGQTVTRVTQRALDTRPTILVEPGELCHVILTKPLALTAAY